ncbi:MAG TPA: inositol monophosphatase family protein [Acidimicrobiales bacterium]
MPTGSPDPIALVDLATEVARKAADLLLEGAQRTRDSVETKTSTTDMVTEMDHASEALIVELLQAARPDDGIVAEEGSSRPGSTGLRWVIDPLDGTTNYLYGLPGWAVSIAAEQVTDRGDRRVLAGVVLDAVHDRLYSAAAGHGARVNGEPIRCSDATDLSRALVGTGFGYQPERRRDQARVLVELLPRVRDIRRNGAAAVDLCLVACGRLDAYYEHGLAWWDHAAGSLIAAEAGAVVSPLGDRTVLDGSIVAAAPGVHAALRGLLDALGASEVA